MLYLAEAGVHRLDGRQQPCEEDGLPQTVVIVADFADVEVAGGDLLLNDRIDGFTLSHQIFFIGAEHLVGLAGGPVGGIADENVHHLGAQGL